MKTDGMLEIFRIAVPSVLILLLFLGSASCATADDVDRLFKDKLNNGNPKIRPIWNQTKVLDVEFTLYIVAMTELDEVKQKVGATVWMEAHWENELVRWNASEYGEIKSVYPKSEYMWKPELANTNGYNELKPVGLDYLNMKLFDDGHTILYAAQKLEFLCKIDVTFFPFDTQTCYMAFMNWAGTVNETRLNYLPSPIETIEALHPNSGWAIVERTTGKLIHVGYDIVQVHLKIQRKPLSLIMAVLLPVFLLSLLNVFVFLLPAESGEKLSFGLTVLLAQAVFLSFISGLMPQTSDSVSWLSTFIAIQLVLSTLYVLLTCCFMRIYHRNTSEKPLPVWFLRILCFIQKNKIHPDDVDKNITVDAPGPSGIQISQRLDKACFRTFLLLVISAIAWYLVACMASSN